jgi:outer membrane protein assembly factor BamB
VVKRALFLTAVILGVTVIQLHGQWPEFRGADGTGTSPAQSVPLTWSEEKNIKWKTAVHGRAWSSPVILDGQVWMTTATEDGTRLYAVALDQHTGRIVHDLEVFRVEKPPEWHPVNSYASPTPALESGRVYVSFGSLGTAAIDTSCGSGAI